MVPAAFGHYHHYCTCATSVLGCVRSYFVVRMPISKLSVYCKTARRCLLPRNIGSLTLRIPHLVPFYSVCGPISEGVEPRTGGHFRDIILLFDRFVFMVGEGGGDSSLFICAPMFFFFIRNHLLIEVTCTR